ncbi:MAG: OmpA family protein [Planctomycetota bacterium]
MSNANSFRRNVVSSAVLGAVVFSAACATPQEVTYTRQVAKDYESQVFDLERQLAEKNAELSRMQERYARERQSSLLNASTDTALRTRIDDLSRMVGELDGPVKDVERFEVDGGYVLMIQDRILFDSGSAELGADGTQALRTIATQIAASAHGTIFVRGHTDSDPVRKPSTMERFPKGNLQLSAERAVSVGSFLTSNSTIDTSDVVVMGFGPHEPLRPNDSAESKRLNRRVEIFVSDPEF